MHLQSMSWFRTGTISGVDKALQSSLLWFLFLLSAPLFLEKLYFPFSSQNCDVACTACFLSLSYTPLHSTNTYREPTMCWTLDSVLECSLFQAQGSSHSLCCSQSHLLCPPGLDVLHSPVCHYSYPLRHVSLDPVAAKSQKHPLSFSYCTLNLSIIPLGPPVPIYPASNQQSWPTTPWPQPPHLLLGSLRGLPACIPAPLWSVLVTLENVNQNTSFLGEPPAAPPLSLSESPSS